MRLCDVSFVWHACVYVFCTQLTHRTHKQTPISCSHITNSMRCVGRVNAHAAVDDDDDDDGGVCVCLVCVCVYFGMASLDCRRRMRRDRPKACVRTFATRSRNYNRICAHKKIARATRAHIRIVVVCSCWAVGCLRVCVCARFACIREYVAHVCICGWCK